MIKILFDTKNRLRTFVVLNIIMFLVFFINTAYNIAGDKLIAFNIASACLFYDYGFIPRAFCQSVIKFIYDNIFIHLDMNLDYVEFYMMTLGIFVFIAHAIFMKILYKFWFKTEGFTNEDCFISFVIYGLANCMLYSGYNTDVLLLLITMLSVYFIRKHRYALIIIPSIVCVCIHEGYLLQFFPIVLSVFLYQAVKEKNEFKKLVFFGFLNLSIVLAFTVYFTFFSAQDRATYIEAMTFVRPFINDIDYGLVESHNVFSQEILGKQYYGFAVSSFLGGIVRFIMSMIYIPMGIYVSKLLIGRIKAKENIIDKLCYIGMYLMLLAPTILLGVMKLDVGRWLQMFWNHVFILYTLMVLDNKTIIKDLTEKIMRLYNKAPKTFLFMNLVILPIGSTMQFNPVIRFILLYITNLLHFYDVFIADYSGYIVRINSPIIKRIIHILSLGEYY